MSYFGISSARTALDVTLDIELKLEEFTCRLTCGLQYLYERQSELLKQLECQQNFLIELMTTTKGNSYGGGVAQYTDLVILLDTLDKSMQETNALLESLHFSSLQSSTKLDAFIVESGFKFNYLASMSSLNHDLLLEKLSLLERRSYVFNKLDVDYAGVSDLLRVLEMSIIPFMQLKETTSPLVPTVDNYVGLTNLFEANSMASLGSDIVEVKHLIETVRFDTYATQALIKEFTLALPRLIQDNIKTMSQQSSLGFSTSLPSAPSGISSVVVTSPFLCNLGVSAAVQTFLKNSGKLRQVVSETDDVIAITSSCSSSSELVIKNLGYTGSTMLMPTSLALSRLRSSLVDASSVKSLDSGRYSFISMALPQKSFSVANRGAHLILDYLNLGLSRLEKHLGNTD